jgi:hypothetical protein
MFRRFFRSLSSATGPATETALRRPATAESNARGEKARERYIQVAATLKTEAGITQHTAHKKMTGQASLVIGAIFAPAGTTRRQLYVLAHECGHIALHSRLKSRRKPRHVEEHEDRRGGSASERHLPEDARRRAHVPGDWVRRDDKHRFTERGHHFL